MQLTETGSQLQKTQINMSGSASHPISNVKEKIRGSKFRKYQMEVQDLLNITE